MNFRKNFLGILSISIFFIILIFTYRFVIAFGYLLRSQKILQGASPIDTPSNEITKDKLEFVLDLLLRSESANKNFQTDLFLGRSYYFLQDYSESVNYYKDYLINENNGNPLHKLEASISLIKLCESLGNLSPACINQNIPFEYIKDKTIEKNIEHAAFDFFKNGNLRTSENLLLVAKYCYEIDLNQLSSNLLLFSKVINGELRTTCEDPDCILFGEKIKIEVENMKWIFGEGVGLYKDGETNYGMLWYSDYVFKVINFSKAGYYKVNVRAKDTPPSPTIIEVAINLYPVLTLNLPNEDEEWIVVEQKIYLEKGVKILTIRLLNDGNVNGLNRNGLVDWIYFESIQ